MKNKLISSENRLPPKMFSLIEFLTASGFRLLAISTKLLQVQSSHFTRCHQHYKTEKQLLTQVWDHYYEGKDNDPGSHVPQGMVPSMIFKIPIREPSYLHINDGKTG